MNSFLKLLPFWANLMVCCLCGESFKNEDLLCESIKTSNGTIPIKIIFKTFFFDNFDDKSLTMTIFATIYSRWYDPCGWKVATERFASKSNSTLEFYPLDGKEIWTPTIVLKNSATENMAIFQRSVGNWPAIVGKDGYIDWEVPGFLEAKCGSAAHQKFPFDILVCDFQVECWMGDELINLTEIVFSQSNAYSFTQDTTLWKEMSRYYKFANRFTWNYGTIETGTTPVVLSIKMRREWMPYIFSIFLPLFYLTLLQLASFSFPPESSNRSIYAVTLILAFTILRDTISGNIPVSSVPVYTVVFADCCTFLSISISFYSSIILILTNDFETKLNKFDKIAFFVFLILYTIIYVAMFAAMTV